MGEERRPCVSTMKDILPAGSGALLALSGVAALLDAYCERRTIPKKALAPLQNGSEQCAAHCCRDRAMEDRPR